MFIQSIKIILSEVVGKVRLEHQNLSVGQDFEFRLRVEERIGGEADRGGNGLSGYLVGERFSVFDKPNALPPKS